MRLMMVMNEEEEAELSAFPLRLSTLYRLRWILSQTFIIHGIATTCNPLVVLLFVASNDMRDESVLSYIGPTWKHRE